MSKNKCDQCDRRKAVRNIVTESKKLFLCKACAGNFKEPVLGTEDMVPETYSAKLDYVKSFAESLRAFIRKGYNVVLTEDNIRIAEADIVFSGDPKTLLIGSYLYYEHNPSLDNGYHTPINLLKKEFGEDIEVCTPSGARFKDGFFKE